MSYVASFFAGVFLCNSVPHLMCGLKGEPFPTPFAKPHGVGNSSPIVNFLWGFANVVIGTALMAWSPVTLTFSINSLVFLAGALAIGAYLSVHFGKVRSQNDGP